MVVYRPPALDKAAPIVDVRTGRITPYFQRFWQNLALTAAEGGAVADAVLKSDFATWSSPSGTLARTTFATYTAPTASATYSQAEMQAAMDALQVVSQHLAALIVDIKN